MARLGYASLEEKFPGFFRFLPAGVEFAKFVSGKPLYQEIGERLISRITIFRFLNREIYAHF